MVNKKHKRGKAFRPGYYDNYRKGNAEKEFVIEPYRRKRSIERPIGAKKIIKRTLYASFLILAILAVVFLFFISAVKINEVYNKISGYTINEGSSKISEIYSRISSKNEIRITNAEILDSDRNFISNIYNDINEKDEKWSVYLYPEEYLRLYFEKNLTNKNDITLFAKSFDNISSQIEIYAAGKERLITKFDSISKENWYKVYLNSLSQDENYNAFDLKIQGNPISFDYATDPTDCYNGIGSNPITICTCADLNKTRDNLTANYVLQNDIDFNTDGGACPNWTSGSGWEPIGNSTTAYRFLGNFSGNNNTISGLFINRSGTNDIGLFGFSGTGSILNYIGLINVSIQGKNSVGSLAGASIGRIFNCFVNGGNVNGTNSVGGLIGGADGGGSTPVINDSYSRVNVSGNDNVGGLIGWNSGRLTNSYAIGNVTGVSDVGGLVGLMDTDLGTPGINNSFATGNISGTTTIGGLLGDNGGDFGGTGIITNSYYNNFTGNILVCIGSASQTGCTAIQNNTAYFYYTNNTPIVNWSFPPWSRSNNGLDFPVLSWQTANCWDSTQNPISICTCWDLNKTRDNLTTNYILQRNINFNTDGGACGNWTSGSGWEPIGNDTNQFKGSFNGNNRTITNLFISRSTTDYIGLFGYLNSSNNNITDLGLINVSILGNDYVGALAGYSNITIDRVYSNGSLNATSSRAGGLIGENYGNINNSYSKVQVTNTGSTRTGGFIGNNFGNIYNSYATGNVSGAGIDHETGGLVGSHQTGANITNCFSTGNVSAISSIGRRNGFVGFCLGSVNNSYWNNISGLTSTCGCSSGCTPIQNNQTYFYNVASIPLVNWTYPPWSNINNLIDYPVLSFEVNASSSDTSYPLFSSYWDNNASLVGSGTGLFNVTVTNTNGTVWLQINGTNYTAGNLSASMYNVSIAGMLNGTYNYTWISWGNGSDKLFNNSALRYYVVNATDTSYPQFSNFISQPVNASNYVNGAVYKFNTTVSYTNGSVGLEFNRTNYTATNSSNNFTASINNLGAGTYNYYWWGYGNGTNKNFNASQIYSYAINKSISQGNLTNTTSWIITYPKSVTIGLEEGNLGDADVTYKVYRNSTDLGTGETIVLGAGYYSYILNTTGGANYSANSSMDSRILQVQQNSTYNFTIVGTTPISYGTSAGISNSSCPSQINCVLNRNNTGAISSPDNSILGVGYYNYTFNTTGNTNYSAKSTSFVLEVQGNATSCNVQFNTTSPKTYPYKFKVFTNCTSAFYITRNGTIVANNSEQDLSTGWYNFSVVRSDTQNYTNVRDSQDFQIAQATPVITKLLNGGTANLTITYPQQSNATGSSTGGTIKIYRDETDVTTENALNVSLSAGTYNYKFNVTGNANYSGLTGEYMNLTIYKAGSPLVITIIPSTSVTSGTETNATGTGCPAGVICNLSRNDTGLVSNPNVQTLAVGYYNYTFNTSGNTNYSSNSTSVILNVTLDTIYPLFSNNETNPANNTQYTPNGIWRFNITITNTNGTAGIDFNGLNYSMSNSSAVFNKTFVNLGGGTYPYYFWAYGNGSNKNFNNSITYSYTIARNSSAVVYTYLNHSRANISIERGNYLWLNATRQTGEGNVKLYNNGNLINTGTNIGNYTLFNSAGIFNITSIYEATQNYSYSNETWWVNVSDSTAPAISIIYPLNITYNTNVSYINYSVNEDGNCWYSNSSGAWNSSSVSAGTNFSGVITKEGSNTFVVYCNDTTGNVNKTNITFIKDTIYPQFSNYTDNTGNFTGTGIAVFNFSIENTNGTVLLYINGVNYTATNLSANVFNVSVSLPAGSYSYYWISWGNGSLNNMNVSATINYVINSAADGSSGGGGSSGGSASCIYNWSCGNWGMCLNGIETRTCINKGNCIGNNGKPEEKRNCIENETEETPGNRTEGNETENLNESLEGADNCGEWGRCRAVYNLNDLIEKRIILKGEQERICKTEKGNLIERRECDTRIPIKTKRVNWCNGNYTEVYDLNESLISRLELTKEIFNVLNIDFEFNQSGYCHYCNNGIKDSGEDEIDCVYEENGSCPLCAKESALKRGLDLCWILFLISIGVLFWLLLKMKKKLCFFSQFFKLSIYDFIVDR